MFTALVNVQVYNPSSALVRFVMANVKLARPTALALLMVILPPFNNVCPSFFHVTLVNGFPSISHHKATLCFSSLVSFRGGTKMKGGSDPKRKKKY